MDLEANKDLVRRWLRALGEGRLDDAGKMVAEDAQYWILGVGDMEMAAIKAFWAQAFSSAPGPDAMKIVGMTAEADRVAAELVSDLKMPNGRDYRNSYHMLLVVRDGQITKVREYMDTAYAQTVFGAH